MGAYPNLGGQGSKNNGIKHMHLVLRRRSGETIVIGENADIKITYYREENGYGHIGIEAPKSVPVNRLEIHERKMKEKTKKHMSDRK